MKEDKIVMPADITMDDMVEHLCIYVSCGIEFYDSRKAYKCKTCAFYNEKNFKKYMDQNKIDKDNE